MSDFLDFVSGLFGLSESEGEFTDFDQNITQKSGDLFHKGLTGQKYVVRFSPVFDEFFVFVEFLESIHVDARNIVFFTLDAVSSSSNHGN